MTHRPTYLSDKKVGNGIFRPNIGNLTMVDDNVPWEVVKAYILSRCPDAYITGSMGYMAEDVIDQGPKVWEDALAIIVSEHLPFRVTMIYKKVFTFF
jgi:hypothetical protein